MRRLGTKLVRENDDVMLEKTPSVRDLDSCPWGFGSWEVRTAGVAGRATGVEILVSAAGEGMRGDGTISVVLCWTGPIGALMTGRRRNGKRGVGRREARGVRSMLRIV